MTSKNEKDKKDIDPSDETDITLVLSEDTFRGALEEADKIPPALVCLVGPPKYQGKRWAITKSHVMIGRTLGNDIIVDDLSVSKSHAKIYCGDRDVTITDLESTNKTIINGRKLTPHIPFALQNNDQVKLGKLIFKFLEKGSIESVSLHKTWELRLRDPLTGIYNREALLLKVEEEFKRAEALTADLSVIIFDIDHFKQVNDTYGHAAGDYVLKEMARITQKQAIRSQDFFARYGGEEFIVILSGSPIEKATEIAERIRKAIEEHDFTFEGQKFSITVSAGIAAKGRDTQIWDDLFKKADKALYKSKRNGRNRVSVS
jgi:two-component system cell cycle response regulator